MMERTSHLAGLQVGVAISNTSRSNKAGSTTVKRARITGQDGTALQFHPDPAWKRSSKTCTKLTNAECTVENS
jgi:hypothetical protein